MAFIANLLRLTKHRRFAINRWAVVAQLTAGLRGEASSDQLFKLCEQLLTGSTTVRERRHLKNVGSSRRMRQPFQPVKLDRRSWVQQRSHHQVTSAVQADDLGHQTVRVINAPLLTGHHTNATSDRHMLDDGHAVDRFVTLNELFGTVLELRQSAFIDAHLLDFGARPAAPDAHVDVQKVPVLRSTSPQQLFAPLSSV